MNKKIINSGASLNERKKLVAAFLEAIESDENKVARNILCSAVIDKDFVLKKELLGVFSQEEEFIAIYFYITAYIQIFIMHAASLCKAAYAKTCNSISKLNIHFT
ncbi:MAG: hypothetical protein RR922_03300 [Clostridia bacterium]